MRPGLIAGHQDAAPYTAVVDGERLAGFCDWDIAGPSPREWDLAFSMLPWVPLASPSPGPSDAPGPRHSRLPIRPPCDRPDSKSPPVISPAR